MIHLMHQLDTCSQKLVLFCCTGFFFFLIVALSFILPISAQADLLIVSFCLTSNRFSFISYCFCGFVF